MSWIGNNLLNSPYSSLPAQPAETAPGQGAGSGAALPARVQSDAMIAGFPGAGVYGGSGSASFGGDGGSGLSSLMAGFTSYVNNLFNQIAAWYGSGSSAGSANPGQNPAPGGNPPQCGPSGGSGQCQAPFGTQETYFSNATASSWGDPHDTFNGTNASGQTMKGSWDNMHSHADLLDSNSFAGGYRVSTQVTPPNAQGVTMNQSASIATASGNTLVSLNASGQYQITSYGNNVTLQPGQTAQLGGGESVTLNGDGSLTVSDTNASGGQISTTLKTNGNGGVDVNAQASGVDLGGYLVSRGDNPRPQPVGPGFPQQPGSPIWRPLPHPDSAASNPAIAPFDQIDQIAN